MKLREERCKILSEAEKPLSESFAKKMIGKSETVLFEKTEDGFSEGFTGNYVRVYVKTERPLDNSIASVIITDYKNGKLFAKLK